MDLGAVRAFVAAAQSGQFREAAAELSVTQQAVSKRIAALEAELGVRLFTRTARGVLLTSGGQAFLPHARAVLAAVERAAAAVHPDRRALRVDILRRHIAPAGLLQGFHRRYPAVGLDVVTLENGAAAMEAVRSGAIDAAFCTLRDPLPAGLASAAVLDEPLQFLTGPGHALAGARWLTPAGLAGHRIWMPGNVAGTEWATFYEELAAAFGLAIDTSGPNFGPEHLLTQIGASSGRGTFVGEQTRLVWADGQDLRRIPLRDPVPVYPHWLIWKSGNSHPGLAALRAHLARRPPAARDRGTWAPSWA